MAFWVRRKARLRRVARDVALTEQQQQLHAGAAAAAAEAGLPPPRPRTLVIPVVIVQPDGEVILAEKAVLPDDSPLASPSRVKGLDAEEP